MSNTRPLKTQSEAQPTSDRQQSGDQIPASRTAGRVLASAPDSSDITGEAITSAA
jgi:hypothetical protein